ncbi:CD3324 family protein [Clostridium diolis]|uniref:CD3324 family protein n=1 Tax=Clostridium diolis TaxID=223919 RepID=UPI00311921B5
MSYIKATEILPKELLNLIQNYIDGEYLYILRRECNKKSWGESTKSRTEIAIRNTNIFKDYKFGICIKVLTSKYYLSEKKYTKNHFSNKKERIRIVCAVM